MNVNKSLLENLRLRFDVDYEEEALKELANLTIAEHEAWWMHPATKALRNRLMNDIAVLLISYAEGVGVVGEDIEKMPYNALKAFHQMNTTYDILIAMSEMKKEVEDEEDSP